MNTKIPLYLYALLTLGPLLMGLGYSLLYSLGLIGLMNDGFTLAHWQRLWQNSAAQASVLYTVALTLVSMLLSLVLAFGVAWQVQQPGTRKNTWMLLLLLPLLFSPLVAALAWQYVLSPGGVVSRLGWQVGLIGAIEDFPRLVNDMWSVGIVVVHVFLVFPIFSLLFIAQADKEKMTALQHTAYTLGASRRQFFSRVFVRTLLYKTRPVLWLYAVFLLGAYEVPLLLGRSWPQTMAMFITEKLTLYNLNDIPVGHAMAVVYSSLVLVIVTVFVKKNALDVF